MQDMEPETKIKMLGSGCVEFKIHYSEMNNIAVGDVVFSENFSVGGHLWRINCYPRGMKAEDMGRFISMYLQLISTVTVKAIFKVFVQCAPPSFSDEQNGYVPLAYPTITSQPLSSVFLSGQLAASQTYHTSQPNRPNKFVQVCCSTDGEDGDTLTWGWNQFLLRSHVDSLYLTNGWATFLCNIIVLDADTIAVPPSNMGRDLSLLLGSKAGADVSFIVKGETIQAHRAILAARSPVFRAELFGSMADATSPSITPQDIEPETFKAMVEFMYTDELPVPDDKGFGDAFIKMMQDLLAAADRYALDRLKLLCARKLWENISEDRFATVLVCADTYNCPELKSKCVDFFAVDKNLKKIIFTEGFQWLVRDFPWLAAELKKRVGM